MSHRRNWQQVWMICVVGMMTTLGNFAYAQKAEITPSVSLRRDGRLAYTPDERGDRIPDFSFCGYRAGNEEIPLVPAVILVPWKEGDATRRIQAAIDYVASLPLNKSGFRGAVLLDRGEFVLDGGLSLNASGVVLRGAGVNEDGTILLGNGETRETLIRVTGSPVERVEEEIVITSQYTPVTSTQLGVAAQHGLRKGDRVFVRRPSTQDWIDELEMNEFGGETGWIGWKPGQRDLVWDREVTSVEGTTITLDAPLTTALDKKFGGGTVARYHWPDRLRNIGIENLQCVSAYDSGNEKDEQHRWMAITLEHVEDAWVRQVVFRHFAGSAVAAYETAKRLTIEDCKSLAPVSEIGGQRRYTFYTQGQQALFQRLYAEHGYHDFAVGFCAPGPNAFVLCESSLPHSFSGAIDSWASGVLFDMVRIDGNALGFRNRKQEAHGAGWTAANSVLWQCSAARIDCYRPPTANNYAFGAWAQFSGDGYWWEPNSHVKPRSLYYAQLKDRIGEDALRRSYLLPQDMEASSSPTVEQAGALTKLAAQPLMQLEEWIDQAGQRQPLLSDSRKVKKIDEIKETRSANGIAVVPIRINNGKLIRADALLAGTRLNVPWWRGDIRPFASAKAKPHITRFVPGRTGHGLMDDLDQVVAEMKDGHIVALEHNYGLWYDRRRDDHERVRRMDGEVWPPFYELPFARSGKGLAWDGLSKYDLTRYNAWYWNRLGDFAEKAEQQGIMLIHHHYFQHNVLEAGAHYADFPWRPANNINDTGFPEPPPYAGDKRIFLAEQFYDVSHPQRRSLHRAYIRKCLDNFTHNTNVLHLISEEYTGPLHFVEFWLDVINEWQKETGRDVMIGLSATKDVQDAILNDETRQSVVDVIDIRYWHYRDDGSLYAPNGGENLAPRQHARLVKPGRSSFEQVFRAVREYRDGYPDKAVLYSGAGYDQFGWAVLMAGGSLPAVKSSASDEFLKQAAAMKPVASSNTQGQWMLEDSKQGGCIVYHKSDTAIRLKLRGNAFYTARWINPANGQTVKQEQAIAGSTKEFARPQSGDIVLWISKDKNVNE